MRRASRIYFAHPICVYGSPQEEVQLQRIRSRFPRAKILNPAEHAADVLDPGTVMNHYLGLLKGCDLVVFTLLYGRITSGVGKEVNFAIDRGIEVYELRGRRFLRRKRRVTFASRAATVRLYERWSRSHSSRQGPDFF